MSESRFADILSGCGQQACDQPILDRDDFVVVPTLGSIVPDWLLVIPRRPVLNFRLWEQETQRSAISLIQHTITRLGHWGEFIWFEHGARLAKSALGCGVEHAHIHLLLNPPFSYSALQSEVLRDDTLNWQRHEASAAYAVIPPTQSYLLVGNSASAVLATDAENAGSQFFRKAIARVVGRPDEWDYRTYAMHSNIATTIENCTRQLS